MYVFYNLYRVSGLKLVHRQKVYYYLQDQTALNCQKGPTVNKQINKKITKIKAIDAML